CEIKSFPDYETYCASCVSRDKETIVFIIVSNEIVRALQGRKVITEYENEDLKNELYFFTGGENIELLFESEDL
ncbi:35128_t:CDS:2, partial [Racocetra persica]